MVLLPLFLILQQIYVARAGSFVYPDFNDTQGLVFNHDAATTSCAHLEGTAMYGDYEGNADKRQHIIGARSRDSQCPGSFTLEYCPFPLFFLVSSNSLFLCFPLIHT